MRSCLIACLLLAGGSGCTSHYLRHSIVNQASTLTELQYQQVLGNLAMLSVDPWALPAHANLRDGSAQVQDVGLANLVAFTNGSQTLPGVTGSRTLVEQWGVLPVTEKVELQLLRIAYRRALGFGDELDVELANDIAHEFCDQLSNSDDINALSDPNLEQRMIQIRSFPLIDDYMDTRQVLTNALNIPGIPASRQQQLRDAIRTIDARIGDEIVEIGTGSYHTLNLRRMSSNDRDIVTRYDDLRNLDDVQVLVANRHVDPTSPPGSLLASPVLWKTPSPIPREARRKVQEIIKDVNGINPGWFSIGRKKDIPPDACYVGRYRDRYAWVCPGEGCRELAELTVKIFDFATIIKERTITTVPGGPRYTPEGNR